MSFHDDMDEHGYDCDCDLCHVEPPEYVKGYGDEGGEA